MQMNRNSSPLGEAMEIILQKSKLLLVLFTQANISEAVVFERSPSQSCSTILQPPSSNNGQLVETSTILAAGRLRLLSTAHSFDRIAAWNEFNLCRIGDD